jgi:MFS family permease
LCFLVALNSFAFAYCLVVSTLGIVSADPRLCPGPYPRRACSDANCSSPAAQIILPTEAVLLYADRHPVMLGLMLACTCVTQLISPVVGYVSDRSTSRWGRRRGLMVGGTLTACVGCVGMYYSRQHGRGGPYILALTFCVFGVNVVRTHDLAFTPGPLFALDALFTGCTYGLALYSHPAVCLQRAIIA